MLPALLLLTTAFAGDLGPVQKAAAHLDAAGGTWFAGRAVDKAFNPWQVELRADDPVAAAREAGAASLEFLAVELNFTLSRGDEHLEVRTTLSPSKADMGLLEVRARDESRPDGIPMKKAPPAAAGLADVARSMAETLSKSDCADPPHIDPAERWADAPILERAKKGHARELERWPETCARLTEAGWTLTHFDVDDVAWLARTEDRAWLGIIEGDLKLSEQAVAIDIGRFDPLPEPEPEPVTPGSLDTP